MVIAYKYNQVNRAKVEASGELKRERKSFLKSRSSGYNTVTRENCETNKLRVGVK